MDNIRVIKMDAQLKKAIINDDDSAVIAWIKAEVEKAIKKGEDVYITDFTEKPIEFAASQGSLNVINSLIDFGVMKAALNQSIIDPARNGRIDVVDLLVRRGANIDIALVNAVFGGNIDIVKLLIRYGADIHSESDTLIAAAWGGHVDMVRFLINAGVNVNEQGSAALSRAIYYKYVDVIRVLIDAGVDVANNMHALQAAAHISDLKTISLLVDAGANIGRYADDILMHAIKNNAIDVIMYVFNHPAVASVDYQDLLLKAVVNKNLEAARIFLDCGADPDADTLQSAANSGDVDMLYLLLAYSTDIPDEALTKEFIACARKLVDEGVWYHSFEKSQELVARHDTLDSLITEETGDPAAFDVFSKVHSRK